MKIWKSPVLRQSFVTAGVSQNVAVSGLVFGFTTGFLEQMKQPNPPIMLDVSLASWVAAMPCLSFFMGNVMAPPIMSKYGRRTTNLISVAPLIMGWVCIFFATEINLLLFGRFLQGISLGLSYSIGTILVGEYTSPKNRGSFLMTVPVTMGLGVLIVHMTISYVSWRITAVICGMYSVINMFIILFSPESPGWLIDKERYDESRKVFRWLRGDGEEIELERMIEANMDLKKSRKRTVFKESWMGTLYRNIIYFKMTITKKEFYKPILIMLHMYSVTHWCGAHMATTYIDELFQRLNLTDCDIPVQIMCVDVVRMISSVSSIFIIKKLKRRTMFFTWASVNIFALLATGIYTYATQNGYLTFYPVITIILTHIMIISTSSGSVPISFVVSGEIFPLEYKNLAGTLSMLIFSIIFFLATKSFPYLIVNFDIIGTYCINAAILIYCSIVTWFILPETKDRTLQDIEDEFRGVTKTLQDMKSAQSLTSQNGDIIDSRTKCSIVVEDIYR